MTANEHAAFEEARKHNKLLSQELEGTKKQVEILMDKVRTYESFIDGIDLMLKALDAKAPVS